MPPTRRSRSTACVRSSAATCPGTGPCGSWSGTTAAISVELHLVAEWGAPFGPVGSEVQARVAEYLARMADVQPARVDVVVDEVGPVRA